MFSSAAINTEKYIGFGSHSVSEFTPNAEGHIHNNIFIPTITIIHFFEASVVYRMLLHGAVGS